METSRILIVEDAPDVARLLQRGLTEEGFEAEVAPTGQVALRKADESWDAIILDLTLPDVPGETIMSYLAQRMDHPPVLVLTARGQLEDKLTLFRQGCDDYLTKPFALEELLHRVKALLRRAPKSLPDECHYEDMRLEASTHQLSVGASKISLTPKEFNICRLLMRAPGRVVSRKELLQAVWGLTHEPRTNFIEVHLANLRKKLGQVEREGWLQTIRASGFLLEKPA
jgi:DNA-binding response OmpR family regulator